MKKQSICIVTSSHVSYNPRVVKEADALSEAGYDVVVVGTSRNPMMHNLDQEMIRSRPWKLATVAFRRKPGPEYLTWFWSGLRQRGYWKLFSRITLEHGFAERAHSRVHSELCRLAAGQPADLYIAHTAQALGAAYYAARRRGARFAFDAEDFHTGETIPASSPRRKRIIEYIEASYLPRCDHVTAASEGIAEALRDKYAIALPKVILNTFPLETLETENKPAQEDGGGALSLYWYSQVIAPGRGLEEAVTGASRLKRPVDLYVRGQIQNGFFSHLMDLVRESRGLCRLHLFEPAPPEELIQLASRHDIGLALEPGDVENRLICASNKLFAYMVAGLAIVATDTPGQKRIMQQIPEAGLLCRMADPDSFASAIDTFLSQPELLSRAKTASRKAAERLFNWDVEKQKLVESFEECFRRPLRTTGIGPASRRPPMREAV